MKDMNKTKFKFEKLVLSSMMAAVCCAATVVIVIPLPYGYLNAGDIFVLISAWLLGPVGCLAAGIGSGLADLFSGYVQYAPATFVIKALVALAAYYLFKLLNRLASNKAATVAVRFAVAVIAEAIMVLGYFVFESVLYGIGGGLLSVVGNTVQALACALGGTLLVSVLENIKPIKRFFK